MLLAGYIIEILPRYFCTSLLHLYDYNVTNKFFFLDLSLELRKEFENKTDLFLLVLINKLILRSYISFYIIS